MLLELVGYLDFLCLMSNSGLVLTDSGGIQEETTILGLTCMTLRNNTERPVTIKQGTNRLVEITTKGILKSYQEIIKTSKDGFNSHNTPKLWDCKAAERIARIIAQA